MKIIIRNLANLVKTQNEQQQKNIDNKNNIMRFLTIISLVFLISCNTNDDPGCFVSDLDFTNLEAAYSCENTKNLVQIDLQDTFTLIQSQSEYDAQVSGPCTPQIDFSLYTLIIGKQGLANGNTSISYNYINDCAVDLNTLTVTFNQNATAEAPNLTYHILSPKVEATTTVEVTININSI